MTQDITINGKNARTEWGIYCTDTSLSELMTPSPQKDIISNESRLEHGKRVITKHPKTKDRDVTLTLNFLANSESEFLANYQSFCRELAKGRLVIQVSYNPDETYRMDYQSCTQFQQFRRRMAKYSLKLNEPDPTNRGKSDKAR